MLGQVSCTHEYSPKAVARAQLVRCADPNSPDLDELARRFHLHELQIEDCRHRPQRAKVDEYGTYMFAVLKQLVPNTQEPVFDDFDVFLGSDFLITVHQGDCAFLEKLCR